MLAVPNIFGDSVTIRSEQHPTGTRHTGRHTPQTAFRYSLNHPDSVDCSQSLWPRNR
jgi:hypothetical protein